MGTGTVVAGRAQTVRRSLQECPGGESGLTPGMKSPRRQRIHAERGPAGLPPHLQKEQADQRAPSTFQWASSQDTVAVAESVSRNQLRLLQEWFKHLGPRDSRHHP